jgi:hypothetical protein
MPAIFDGDTHASRRTRDYINQALTRRHGRTTATDIPGYVLALVYMSDTTCMTCGEASLSSLERRRAEIVRFLPGSGRAEQPSSHFATYTLSTNHRYTSERYMQPGTIEYRVGVGGIV